jgi:hypothetical protein
MRAYSVNGIFKRAGERSNEVVYGAVQNRERQKYSVGGNCENSTDYNTIVNSDSKLDFTTILYNNMYSYHSGLWCNYISNKNYRCR